jgi:hypothetical protein
MRTNPLVESKRLEKWYRADKMAKSIENVFEFNNSINLNESGEMEKVFFAAQIEKLLGRLTESGLALREKAEPKSFFALKNELNEKRGLWDNIHAKRERIKRGSGERMRKPGSKGAPTADAFKAAAVKEQLDPKTKAARYTGVKTSNELARQGRVRDRHVVSHNREMHRIATSEGILDMFRSNKNKLTLQQRQAAERGEIRAKAGLKPPPKKPSNVTDVFKGDERRGNEWTANRQMAGIQKEETKITGTNCANCIWLKKDSEKPVDKSELNSNGGLKPTSEAYIDMAKHVDLVSLPGKATVKTKAFCDHEDVQDFVTERMCCAYWDNEDAKRDFKGKADVMDEETDINQLFEMQLMGTDEYRKHAIAMTPGQTQEIQNAYQTMEPTDGKEECSCGGKCNGKCGCGGSCGGDCSSRIREGSEPSVRRRFSSIRASLKEAKKESIVEEDTNEIDLTPTLKKRKNPKTVTPGKAVRTHIDGLPVTARLYGEQVSLKEAVQYHLDNKVSFTENVFRPGSDMFFQMIGEAKRLFAEGTYAPADEYEQDLLESNIGETGIYEGEEVLLDFPFEETDELNESSDDIMGEYKGLMKLSIKDLREKIKQSTRVVDASGFKSKDHAASHLLRRKHGDKKVAAAFDLKEEDETGGKGIGKPFRSGGGGAVYVKNAKGNVIKVNFSQSGMKKRINEPARVRSFVARHGCLTNKDKTSASYWACRWPRYFSNTGQQWW